VKKVLRFQGQVFESLPDAKFRVRLTDGREVLCHLAGKLRMFRIKILPGDQVTVEMSPYDDAKGRIVYRGRA
jgi:translation initiation factor IF-1